jgi:LysM repeat protein
MPWLLHSKKISSGFRKGSLANIPEKKGFTDMKKLMFIILALVLFSSLTLVPCAFAFKVSGEEVVSQSTKQIAVSQRFVGSEPVSTPVIKTVYRTVYKPIAVPDKADCREYVVVKGDTLDKIAESFGTKREVLLALNSTIKNPNVIRVGQVLKVPAPYSETKTGKMEAANTALQKRAKTAESNIANLERDLTIAKAAEQAATNRAEYFMKRAEAAEAEAIIAEKIAAGNENLANSLQADLTKAQQEAAQLKADASGYQFTILFSLACAVLFAVFTRRANSKIRTIEEMLGGQEIQTACPYGCGETLLPKNYNRHVHKRCPKRPGVQKTEEAKAEAAEAEAAATA